MNAIVQLIGQKCKQSLAFAKRLLYDSVIKRSASWTKRNEDGQIMNKSAILLSYKQAMEYLGIGSYHTLYKLIDNDLPVVKIGSTKKIDRNDIDRFLNDHKVREVKS